jgi:asparagine synthase (glutamine-hydrolysing)
MCGILGFNWEDGTKLRELTALLHHRGPEQEGYHVGDGVSLGHKRLCILDVSERGRQPMYNEDGAICVTYNGEIFNFPELREELEAAGHAFTSHCDTEVLVHGYEQWGLGLIERLNGQFAFCILDKARAQLVLVRDRLGIKPLYYHDHDGRFLFASELKGILRAGIDRRIDAESLEHYILFGYTPGDRSILEGVNKLLPAHYLVYDLRHKRIECVRRYWDVHYDEAPMSEAQAVSRVRQRIGTAVRRQLISNVPLGAFLSGGVDSSIIVAEMRPHVSELKTFSIRFDYGDFDESPYAAMVSRLFETKHYEIAFSAGEVGKIIPSLPYYYDEPFGDSSMLPTYLVSSVARREVTVSLSGTGGDELFGGYHRYFRFPLLRWLNGWPGPMKDAVSLAARVASRLLGRDAPNRFQPYLGPREPAYVTYLTVMSCVFRNERAPKDRLAKWRYAERYFALPGDAAGAMNCDVHEYLPNDLLVKEDRASMAVSLEARVPLLDHELVEFAAGLPMRYKIRRGVKKWLLKKAYADVLPPEVLHRRKQGFGVPLVHYFRNELRELARQAVFDAWQYDVWDRPLVERLWQEYVGGRADHTRLLWSIMMFNLWYERWMR